MNTGYALGVYLMGTVASAIVLPVFALRLIAWVMHFLGLRER